MVSPKFTLLPQKSPEPYEKHISSQTVVLIIISFSLNTVTIFFKFKANLKKKLPVYLSYQLAAHTSKKNTFFHSLTSLMLPLELLFFILAKTDMAKFCHIAMAIIFAT